MNTAVPVPVSAWRRTFASLCAALPVVCLGLGAGPAGAQNAPSAPSAPLNATPDAIPPIIAAPGDLLEAMHLPPTRLGAAEPNPATCPAGLPAQTRCLNGRDYLGAWYWIAVPKDWNGVLVMHVHGGPALGEPTLARTTADLQRWSALVKAGYAWAGSSFRQGGVEVLAAGEDTERLREITLKAIGQPKRTVLHGQSWGASVAARMAERYVTPDPHTGSQGPGPLPYDGVLLTSGVLAGATRAYDVRLDLRVLYQAMCNNHPRPNESAYPLWMGLPLETQINRVQLAERVDECLGLKREPKARSAEQQKRLDTLTRVLKLPESSLLEHLQWATWHFHDITVRKLKGRNPFGNEGVRYQGSEDDDALNRNVVRYKADPGAVADLARDADPNGRLLLPTLTLHGVDDPVAFVEMEAQFRDTVTDAGSADLLAQVFTADREHSYFNDAEYLAALQTLLDWVDKPRQAKPDAAAVDQHCKALPAQWQPEKGCHVLVGYEPAALDSRVPPRKRLKTSQD